MRYKTMTIELLRDQCPALHRRLKERRTLAPMLDRYARVLKALHDFWTSELNQAKPGSDPSQALAEALELALEGLRRTLRAESPPDEDAEATLSLDEAMTSLRRRTPPA